MFKKLIYKNSFEYELIDSAFCKKISLPIDTYDHNRCHDILTFLYREYKHSSECPFKIIKDVIDSKNIRILSSNIIISTNFYFENRKIMDKIVNIQSKPEINNKWGMWNDAIYTNYTNTTSSTAISYEYIPYNNMFRNR